MRSQYEDSAAMSTDNNKYHTTYSYNNNHNNNNNYHNGNGNGIPYHARENSLPFSYGIATASTPLRKTPTPTRADSFLDFEFGLNNNNSNSNNNSNNNHNNQSNNNGDMIKPQPRLTSPLLVRKTLGSRANTNTNGNTNGNPNTNTISNTYHYGATTTPLRTDFEQLLRDRREKVYSEHRMHEKEHENARSSARVPPTPPQRRFSNCQPATSKYNYDFEFNLNLNDVNERSSQPAPYHTRNIEVQQMERNWAREPERERERDWEQNMDVPDGAIRGNSRRLESTIVERNYHTINSQNNHKNSLERPPMDVTHKRLANNYGQNQVHLDTHTQTHTQTQTHTRNRRDLSPIYATSNKPRNNAATATTATTATTVATVATAPLGYQNGQTDYSPTSRPETPAFPVTPRTPFGSTQRGSPSTNESIYQTAGISARQQPTPTFEVAPDLVKFARNSAKFWYKANLSREDAIALLMNAPSGTFLVRDSTTYKNAYGLVLRVAQPPAGSQELVRHFLIEPTQRGVRLKGCANEPVFTSLSALIYEHSINQLALPCLLRIPEADVVPSLATPTSAQQQLLTHGAATNVLWLFSCDTESLTGNEAIRKAIRVMYDQRPLPLPTEVHFKVTGQGITLTDNTRKKFFRKHYTADVISHCAIDPENRMWTNPNESDKKTIFAFVARRSHSSKDNQCHVFCDLSVAQPAAAIVSFANRTLPTEKQRNYVL